MDGGAWWAAVPGVAKSPTRLSDFTLTFHFHALEKEVATHSSSCLENPRDGEPGGLLSMGSHRVGHDWRDLAAAAGSEPEENHRSPRAWGKAGLEAGGVLKEVCKASFTQLSPLFRTTEMLILPPGPDQSWVWEDTAVLGSCMKSLRWRYYNCNIE